MWTEKWTKFWNSWLNRVLNIFHSNHGDRFAAWDYITIPAPDWLLIWNYTIKDRDNAVWHCLCYEHRGEEAHRWCGQSSVTLQSLPNASIVWTNFHNLAIDKAFVSLDLDKLDSVNFDTKPHCKRKPCLHNSGNLGNIAIWLLRCKTSFGYWVRPSALWSIFCLSKRKGIQ